MLEIGKIYKHNFWYNIPLGYDYEMTRFITFNGINESNMMLDKQCPFMVVDLKKDLTVGYCWFTGNRQNHYAYKVLSGTALGWVLISLPNHCYIEEITEEQSITKQ